MKKSRKPGKTGLTRREFLAKAAGATAALPLVGIDLRHALGIPQQEQSPSRLAIAMWDFSWLVRRHGNEAEYVNWDQVLDELAIRGYNCVRIDAFPHLVAGGPDGDRSERFTILPQPRTFPWGNHSPVEVEPRKALTAFMGKAKERGIRAGFSSWFVDDTLHRCNSVRTPEDFTRIWLETLKFIDSEGHLDIVEWVDLCNEFPAINWAVGAYPLIFGSDSNGEMKWNQKVLQAVQRYIDESIAPLRKIYPKLKYTFSLQVPEDLMKKLNLRSFDLIELHIWLTEDGLFGSAASQLFDYYEERGEPPPQVGFGPMIYRADKKGWIRILEGLLSSKAEWAREVGLPLYTTEGWATVFYKDMTSDGKAKEWTWVKELCAHAVSIAVEKGWAGLCTSNFCQPHFRGMWSDVRWHQEMTNLIRGK
jgi:hypothetical protein